MTAENQDFTITRGDHAQLLITVRDSDDNPKLLTGATINWQCAPREVSATAIISKISGVSPSEIDIVGGSPDDEFIVFLVPADTILLTEKFYYHEAEVTDINGNIVTVTRGLITTKPQLIGV